jgi:hypothetical protein
MAQRRAVRDSSGFRLNEDIVELLNQGTSHDLKNVTQEQLNKRLAKIAKRRARAPAFRDRAPPRAKKLKLPPGYDNKEADYLYKLIAEKKRDIKLIREAMTQQGAQNYIDRRGLGEFLVVDNTDIDGDNIPDIIVRERGTDMPIIVKGYKTEQSDYPIRYSYYTDIPRERRKGYPMKDYITEKLGTRYTRPTEREFIDVSNANMLSNFKRLGYKDMFPRTKITIPNAFKVHVFKPIMKCLKEVLKEYEIPLNLGPVEARDMETAIRNQLITIPAMQALYGDEILNIDEADWKSLQTGKDYNENAHRILLNLLTLSGETLEDLYRHILGLIIGRLVFLDAVPERLANAGDVQSEIVNKALGIRPPSIPGYGAFSQGQAPAEPEIGPALQEGF